MRALVKVAKAAQGYCARHRGALASLPLLAMMVLATGVPMQRPAYAGKAAMAAARDRLHLDKQSGAVALEYWFRMDADKNGLVVLISGCFKLSGVLQDEAGGPTWTEATFKDTKATAPANKCQVWMPVGAIVTVKNPAGKLDSYYAQKEVTGKLGSIFISFSGTATNDTQATGHWIITGGTGAYTGLQGAGTAMCDAAMFPYEYHVETGNVWWVSTT